MKERAMNIFKNFIGWSGADANSSGGLVAKFAKANPLSAPRGKVESSHEAEVRHQERYNKDSLDGVLSNPKAKWSPEDRALLETAQATYPGKSGPG
jgi:hypothetical protein